MFPTKCWLFFLLMIINLPCVYLSKKAPQLKPTLLEPPERETLLHLTVRADFFRILAMYCFFLNLKAATYNFHRLRQVSKVYIRNCFFAIVSHGIDWQDDHSAPWVRVALSWTISLYEPSFTIHMHPFWPMNGYAWYTHLDPCVLMFICVVGQWTCRNHGLHARTCYSRLDQRRKRPCFSVLRAKNVRGEPGDPQTRKN